jgi:hypothetical protein
MGKGQRAKKEQASLTTAAFLSTGTKKSTPSHLAMENQRVSSNLSPSAAPYSFAAPSSQRAPAVTVTAPTEPTTLSFDQQKMTTYFANDSATRLLILKNFFFCLAEEFSQLRIEAVPSELHQMTFTALELINLVQRGGLTSPEGSLILCSVINSIQGDYSKLSLGSLGRGFDSEIALKIISGLQSPDALDREMEAIVVTLLPALLKFHNHKNNRIRDLSGQICQSFSASLLPQVQDLIFPTLMTHIQPEEDWKVRAAALDIPKKQLSSVATETMLFSCSFISNDDISQTQARHPSQSITC